MLNEPRIYKHSPIQIGLTIFIFGALGIGLLVSMDSADFQALIPIAGLFGIIFLIVLYSMTIKTILSDSEISTQSLLGTKSLRWNEINRVSGRGYGIKLHNFDGDVTVTPSQQLPRYEEIVELIGVKRPDLFNPLEYSEMKKGWSTWVSFAVFALILIGTVIGFGVSFFNSPRTTAALFMPMLIAAVIFIVFFGLIFSSPQSLTLNGNSMFIKYLFSEKTMPADEIASVELRFTQTRNGKNYFILISQRNKKTLRISGLSPSLPIAYLVLKNWHKKNAKLV
jgi:Na+/melibiose symporter-like transporter